LVLPDNPLVNPNFQFQVFFYSPSISLKSDLEKTFIKMVFSELKKGYSVLSDCLVKVDNRVSEIMRMIGPYIDETLIAGTHGVGGARKTALVIIIYNQLSPDFEDCCFLSNILETSKVKGGE